VSALAADRNPRFGGQWRTRKKSATFDPKQGGFFNKNRKIDRMTGRVTILNQ
jgi:hypothetical protein